MRTKHLRLIAVSICALCTTAFGGAGQAHYVNSINFLGAGDVHDSEAEYRLLKLATAIVETRQLGAQVSLSVKAAYGASILGNIRSSSAALNQARTHGNALHDKWAEVGQIAQDTAQWLDRKLRPEYAKAFCKVAGEKGSFHKSLIEVGASDDYMSWAFDELANACGQESSSEKAVLSTFAILTGMAQTNGRNVSKFFNTLNEVSDEQVFADRGMYGYIFDNLAVRATKPGLFVQDEVYFTGLVRFDIFYEALEQVSREAHTRIPGTHDQTFRTFDLKFTK